MADKKEVHVSETTYGHADGSPMTAQEREAMEDAEMKLEAAGQDPHPFTDDPDWKPGYMARFPWLGFGALAFVLLCAIACVLVLSFADGKSQSKWPKRIAPNVIITVLNSIANLAFGKLKNEHDLVGNAFANFCILAL